MKKLATEVFWRFKIQYLIVKWRIKYDVVPWIKRNILRHPDINKIIFDAQLAIVEEYEDRLDDIELQALNDSHHVDELEEVLQDIINAWYDEHADMHYHSDASEMANSINDAERLLFYQLA